ncbi:type II CAAX endopeptidase family protein [Chloroflexus sp.]|uniref:CPBP family intramembrane glutamic endopeptidase n=1 Tax=Chloroflexus sp. TaxID=1904827 RepID=UPI002ADE6FC3|nr:type II CAAX endopeptidase family protein [Chloroflexus sp.]
MSGKQRSPATLIGLCVALGLPFILTLVSSGRSEVLWDTPRTVLIIAQEWVVTIILIGIVIFWERRTLASIGIVRTTWRDVLWGLVGFVLGALSFVVTMPLVTALGLETTTTGISQLAQTPLGLRIAIVITAGITEEILFRGYPIERFTEMTGKIHWGAGIAYLAFVLLHIPFWGLGGTIQIGVWSLIVTSLYVWRRNLLTCIMMHVLNDGYAFILLPELFAQYLPQ